MLCDHDAPASAASSAGPGYHAVEAQRHSGIRDGPPPTVIRSGAQRKTSARSTVDAAPDRDAERIRAASEPPDEKKRAEVEAVRKKGEDDARVKSDAERQRLAMLQQEDERKRTEAEAAKKRADAAGAIQSGSVFRDCPECPEMVVVPAGEFMMGSPASEEAREAREGPQHKVTIARAFAVGKFEVTFVEWDACVAAGGCTHKPGDEGWGRGKRPVMNVSWDDITKQYLPWLSRKTGKTYRLLSEAEWEYAARAGTTTPFSTGRTITPEQANFSGNYTYGGSAKGEYRRKTVEVGTFAANAFGLHDMHGNVWELVADCYKDGYAGAPADGSAITSGHCGFRILRGGSWINIPRDLRSAASGGGTSGDRHGIIGFRVARTL